MSGKRHIQSRDFVPGPSYLGSPVASCQLQFMETVEGSIASGFQMNNTLNGMYLDIYLQ